MPDSNGRFLGKGWSRAQEDAWTRVFGDGPDAQARHDFLHSDAGPPFVPDVPDLMAALEASLSAVPREPSHEDFDDRDHEQADRAESKGWGT